MYDDGGENKNTEKQIQNGVRKAKWGKRSVKIKINCLPNFEVMLSSKNDTSKGEK